MITFWILYAVISISSKSVFSEKIHAPADFVKTSSSPFYVDKTIFIIRYFHYVQTQKCQVILSPHGFLKSTNLNMLKKFAQIEVDSEGKTIHKNDTEAFKLFTDKKFEISKYDMVINDHLAEYPVVHFEFSDIFGASIPDIFTKLSINIRKMYQEYEWLYKLYDKKYPPGYDPEGNKKERAHLSFMQTIFQSEELKATEIKESIYQLVEILYTYFNKEVIVLIDDFDAPLIDVISDKNNDLAVNLISNIIYEVIGKFFKQDMEKYVKYMLVVGTNSLPLPIETNQTVFRPFLSNHPLTYHFAFTKEEISAKLNKLKYPPLTFREVNAKLGGYQLKELRMILCRPDGFVRFLKNQTHDFSENKWIDGGSLAPLSVFLNNSKIREKIDELVKIGNVSFEVVMPINITHFQTLSEVIRGLHDVNDFDVNVFFTILLENGYLAYLENTKLFYGYLAHQEKVNIFNAPNQETSQAFKNYYSLYKAT